MRRKVTVFTPGKQYSGEVDIPNDVLRTTELFNSTNIYWKDPGGKGFNDSLLMYNVTLSITGVREFQKFNKLQVRQPDIICYNDDLTELSSTEEKTKAEALREKASEEQKNVFLITKMRGSSFFMIKGIFYGLFKSKSIKKYIPLSDVVLLEIIRQQDKWVKNKIPLANNFVGVNTNYIESCSFD